MQYRLMIEIALDT